MRPARQIVDLGRASSVAAGGGTNVSECRMGPSTKSRSTPPTLTLQQADACVLSVLSSQAKPGTERHALKRCGACMRPSSAHKFAGIGLQASGITHLRYSDSLRSLLSHFPLRLKPGKIRRSPSASTGQAAAQEGDTREIQSQQTSVKRFNETIFKGREYL